ncbi:FkbM family methyltransferase [Roseomonas sp. NAR14]|uniref:FkbM family methyltransferase n=1 Tax=Roseomonas acroporae TaxID=2937791 RepID=A0A9X1Y856_9PROT|nr:FkbM family methyltransferase [Roseomonas acroporae]MCK8783872.1 FkbM family methyltransferase [Roseomonas acroporae]
MTEGFVPYIARDRRIGPYRFDMLITDPVAKDWYDSSPDQWMRERQWCIDTIRPGFTVLDCGAHHGLMTTLFALATGPTGVVHAWDPSPANAEVIARNAALNGCANVVVHACGVGDAPAELPFFENRGNVMVLGERADLAAAGKVRIVRLDDDIDPGLKVDFLKMDVEGHDLPALRGATRILGMRPYLMLELHLFLYEDRLATVTAILELLARFGYSMWLDDFQTAVDIGASPDPARLTSLEHAQLYCVPV